MKVSISSLDSEKFVGLFREIKKDVWRLTDIGIRGYENEYMKEGDIVVKLRDVNFGDELIIKNKTFVIIKYNNKHNSKFNSN